VPPIDLDHFVDHGWLMLNAGVPPSLCDRAIEYLATIDDVEEVAATHPDVLACITDRVDAAVAALTGPHRRCRYSLSDYHRRSYEKGGIQRFQALHVDDDYPTLLPNDSAMAMLVFLNDVPTDGGTFHHVDRSYATIRAALARTPDAYFGYGEIERGGPIGPFVQVTARRGDVLIFHHLHAHCGSNNVSIPDYTRQALLFRIYAEGGPPPALIPPSQQAPLDRANTFGTEVRPAGLAAFGDTTDEAALETGVDLGEETIDYDLCYGDGDLKLFTIGKTNPECLSVARAESLDGFAEIDRISPNIGALVSASVGRSVETTYVGAVAADGRGRVLTLRDGRLAEYGQFDDAAALQFTIGSEGEASTVIHGDIVLRLAADRKALLLHAPNAVDVPATSVGATVDLQGLPVRPRAIRVHPCRAEWYFGVLVDTDDGSAAWAGRAHDIARFDASAFVPLIDTIGRPVAAPRLIARAQDLWLVGYVTPAAPGRLFYGLLDWTAAPRVDAIRDRAGLRHALARIGFA
jgi:hypothetical protein